MLFNYCFSFLKHGSRWTYRLTKWLVLLLTIGTVTVALTLHYFFLPNIDDYRAQIARSVALAMGQSVDIGRIEGRWRDYRPELNFFNVRVHEASGRRTLAFDRVDTVLSWRSFSARNVVFHLIEIAGPDIEIRRDSLGTLWVAGTLIERSGKGDSATLANWLEHQDQISVRGARISWIDEMRGAPALVFDEVSLLMQNDGAHHRFGVTGKPPLELASTLTLSGDFESTSIGDLSSWHGRIFGEFEYANLAYAQRWISYPERLDSGLGELRLWMDFDGYTLERVVAEASLVNVSGRLAPHLEPLALASLSGVVQWDQDASARNIAMSNLSLQTVDGIRLETARIAIRQPLVAGSNSELEVSSLNIGPVLAMIKSLPMDAEFAEKLARFEPAGVVENLKASWPAQQGAVNFYDATVQFRDIAVIPVDSMPGFSGMSGSATFSQDGGSVALVSMGASLEFPRVFADSIAFDSLIAEADWQFDKGNVRISVPKLSFANQHAAGQANGSYFYPGQGRGDIKLRANLTRGEAQHVWRYFPIIVPKTQGWLKQGLVAGYSNDVQFHLEGSLDNFPFADKRDGILEVKAVVHDAVVQITDQWPKIEEISGDFLVSGNRIDINPSTGAIMGADVSKTRVSVLELGSGRERVLVDGKAVGAVGQFLQFVANSPVAGYTRGSTANMRGQGIGSLDLKMELPIRRLSDVTVDGYLDVSGPTFNIDQRMPDLTQYAVRVEFSEHDVKLQNGKAELLGGPLWFRTVHHEKGSAEVSFSGLVDAGKLARFSNQPLLGRMSGQTRWNGHVIFRDSESLLHLESTLLGIDSRLPAPLDKLAANPVPISIDAWSTGGTNHEFALGISKVGSARWLTESGSITRGAVAFGGVAVLPKRPGVTVRGKVEALDIDAWQSVLATGEVGSKTHELTTVDSLDLKFGMLRFAGRRFRNLAFKGKRIEGNWQIGLLGPQIDGTVLVSPQSSGSPRVNGRFTSLVLPSQEASISEVRPKQQADEKPELPPAMDVIVEDFRIDGKQLGRLELLAEPGSDKWQLEHLKISNSDGRADIKGHWRVVGRPHTEYVVDFQASDVGKFLRRLGYEETIVGGEGSLTGPVSWLGGPFRPDLPTLSGKLELKATGGRFAQVDPGVARLIGILSLQALPRRLTFNFKDVFSTGFRFDTISADLTVAQGIVRTEDFRMEGVAAHVTIKGDVNLANETQFLDIHVRPQLSGAAAVGAAVINPLAGVATLLVQKALGDPFEQIASRDYRVTGPWGKNAQVELLKRQLPGASRPNPGR